MTITFGARVRFVTDAGRAPELSPIGRKGTWIPDYPDAQLGSVWLDRPLLFLSGSLRTDVRATINDLEAL